MPDPAATEDRPMRSHARRNRERIIEVAREALADPHEDISLNEVARRAEVGIGTLFRHFPTREALLEALLHDRTAALCDEADRLLLAPRPGPALFGWLRDLVAHVAAYRGVSALLLAGAHDEHSALHAACRAVDTAAESLLVRAQRSGDVRADIDLEELISLVSGLSWIKEQAPERGGQVDTLLTVMADGLRTRPA